MDRFNIPNVIKSSGRVQIVIYKCLFYIIMFQYFHTMLENKVLCYKDTVKKMKNTRYDITYL